MVLHCGLNLHIPTNVVINLSFNSTSTTYLLFDLR